MKKFLTVLLSIFLINLVSSQDVIHLLNGQRLKCKVKNISSDSIYYYNNKTNKQLSITKEGIKKLVFADNTEIYFSGSKEKNQNGKPKYFRKKEEYLSMENSFFGLNYFFKGRATSKGEIEYILNNYPPLVQSFKSANNKYNWSQVIGGISGVFFGFQIGRYLGSGLNSEAINPRITFISGFTYTICLFSASHNKGSISNIFCIFNKENDASMSFGPTLSGIGLILHF